MARPRCLSDPAWVPWGPRKGATRVLQPCACVPAHLLLCPESLRPRPHVAKAALPWRPCMGALGPQQRATRVLQPCACVPAHLLLCPDSLRPRPHVAEAVVCWRPCMGAWGPSKGPRGFSSPVLVFLRIYCSVPTPCCLVQMLPRPSCASDPAWVPWGPRKGATRVLQPCA